MIDDAVLIEALRKEGDFCKDVAKNIDEKSWMSRRLYSEFAFLCDRLKNRIEHNTKYYLGIENGKLIFKK